MSVTDERVEQAQDVSTEPAARTTAQRMFRYSDFIDVGEGAAECEHSRDGQCQDHEHFHAWIRLPNPYQHEDIRKKALAAKARKLRELKDPESDASVVLDQDLVDIADPIFASTVIDELLAREWAEDYLKARDDVDEREEFEHIKQDREEYNRLIDEQEKLSEEEQSAEYKQLTTHLNHYVDVLNARLAEVQAPKREELAQRPIDAIIALVRGKRVDEQADHVFIETYDAWMWFVGTYEVGMHPTLGRPHLPKWEEMGVRDRPSAGTMFSEAPEVVEALKAAFTELQFALQKASAGN